MNGEHDHDLEDLGDDLANVGDNKKSYSKATNNDGGSSSSSVTKRKRARGNIPKAQTRLASSYKTTTLMLPPDDRDARAKTERLVVDLTSRGYEARKQFLDEVARLKRRYKLSCKNSYVRGVYLEMVAAKVLSEHPQMEYFFRTKVGKSASGILSITVFTSPYPSYVDEQGRKRTQKFTCEWNCYFCPNHPDHPRSYLPDEPGCLRAERCGFDAAAQLTERVATLEHIGHPVDKLEVLVLGGTWESYPASYQEEFIRDLFWAANTFFDSEPRRERRSLAEEQVLNEGTRCKIIGLTLETRPDTINPDSVRQLRRYGCTRLQIGLQHIDNAILDYINRRHTIEEGAEALKLLKDNCFKVDVHLMPDLPGSSVERDHEMFNSLLGVHSVRQVGDHSYEYDLVNKDIQADQWKVYPCEVTPWTVIEKWFKEGKYQPYGDGEELVELLIDMKSKVFPWIRLNRIVRDIPNQHILGGNATVNLRQSVVRLMKQRKLRCKCIRCREVGLNSANVTLAHIQQAVLVERRYEANDGIEYFLSYETPDETILFGFLRLRIARSANVVFPVLRNAGLVRELHVYGQLIPTYRKLAGEESSQHSGFGSRLMRRAEELAWSHGCTRTAVIAGIGTRNYYRKLGYTLEDTFLVRSRPLFSRVVGHECSRLVSRYARVLLFIVYVVCAILMHGYFYGFHHHRG